MFYHKIRLHTDRLQKTKHPTRLCCRLKDASQGLWRLKRVEEKTDQQENEVEAIKREAEESEVEKIYVTDVICSWYVIAMYL